MDNLTTSAKESHHNHLQEIGYPQSLLILSTKQKHGYPYQMARDNLIPKAFP
jgi:hypothetical protein